MVAKLTIWSILSALGPKCYKMMAFQVSSSTPFRFSAFQASFNDPLRGFGAFLVSFNEPLRGFGTFQVSFNDPSEGLQPSRSLSTTPSEGLRPSRPLSTTPPRGNPRQGPFNQPLRRVGALSNPYEGASQLARTDCHRRGWLKKSPYAGGPFSSGDTFLRPASKTVGGVG